MDTTKIWVDPEFVNRVVQLMSHFQFLNQRDGVTKFESHGLCISINWLLFVDTLIKNISTTI